MNANQNEKTSSNPVCYVDETGKDYAAQFFLVSVILFDREQEIELRQRLERIRENTSKYKWSKSNHLHRQRYLESIAEISDFANSIYYSVYPTVQTDEISLTVQTIAAAIKKKGLSNQKVDIIIDALSKNRKRKIEKELASAGIKAGMLYSHQTEQNVFLQLADYMAGFLRDHEEKQKPSKQGYPETIFNKLNSKLRITKLTDERKR